MATESPTARDCAHDAATKDLRAKGVIRDGTGNEAVGFAQHFARVST